MQHQVSADISVFPINADESLKENLAPSQEVIGRYQQKVHCECYPGGTTIQGDLDEVLELVKELHDVSFGESTHRLVTTIRLEEEKKQQV